MSLFYYQIKGRQCDGFGSNWVFPPIWSDFIEANDRKHAKALIEEEFEKQFPLRVLKKDLAANDFFLVIKETSGNKHLLRLREVNTCKNTACGRQFAMIEKYQLNDCTGGYDYCSIKCHNICHTNELINSDGYILHEPVIYKITRRGSGKCYIGKTTQAFTLRWYQHFFQTGSTKFHAEIKTTSITEWTFEVLEVINKRGEGLSVDELNKFILARERYYIILFDSINDGYNTQLSENNTEAPLTLSL